MEHRAVTCPKNKINKRTKKHKPDKAPFGQGFKIQGMSRSAIPTVLPEALTRYVEIIGKHRMEFAKPNPEQRGMKKHLHRRRPQDSPMIGPNL